MKYILLIFTTFFLFLGCSKEPKVVKNTTYIKELPRTKLIKTEFSKLPNWENGSYKKALYNFLYSCKTSKTRKLYKNLCKKGKNSTLNPKLFIESEFTPYEIISKDGLDEGLLTGYYEPELKGSLTKTKIYKYPIYETPKDLVTVDLGSIYPKLKDYRLRGRVVDNKLIPYYTREESLSKKIPAKVICYTDSKIDLFFLEIQGSGRVTLDDGRIIFIGFDNQNGHRYRAIGRYLVKIGALEIQDVSLQTIRKYLDENPSKVDEVLNYNKSVVYFKQRKKPASGSLGVELTPMRSVAVDRRYIPLGAMLYLSSTIRDRKIERVVFAQDTGGAIKGAIRADMFLGHTKEAMEIAGELKSPLKLWILLPKKERYESYIRKI